MDPRILYLTSRLASDFCRQWTIEKMARSVKLSPAHLHRLFKEQLGISPILYLRQLRLEHAGKLLESSYERIKDIRLQVGMIDSSHFASDFKAKYGVQPSVYRRQRWSEQQKRTLE